MSGLPRGFHELQFLPRCDPRENTHTFQDFLKIERRQRFEFRSRDDLVFMVGQTEFPCDRQRGDAMVSGDHHHLDTGLMAVVDRLARPGPQRVNHPHEAQEFELFRFRRRVARPHRDRQSPARHRQHTQAEAGHFRRRLLELAPLAAGERSHAHVQNAFWRALHEHDRRLPVLVERRRELMLGFKRDAIHLRERFEQLLASAAQLLTQAQQGDVHRIAAPHPTSVAMM